VDVVDQSKGEHRAPATPSACGRPPIDKYDDVGWARDPAEPGAGDNQGPAETADLSWLGTGPTPGARPGTGPTPTLRACAWVRGSTACVRT
jgi:hypothetical protein